MDGLEAPRSRQSVLHGVSSAFAAAVSVSVSPRLHKPNRRSSRRQDDQGTIRVSDDAERHLELRHLHAVRAAQLLQGVEDEVSQDGWCKAFTLAD